MSDNKPHLGFIITYDRFPNPTKIMARGGGNWDDAQAAAAQEALTFVTSLLAKYEGKPVTEDALESAYHEIRHAVEQQPWPWKEQLPVNVTLGVWGTKLD